MKLNKDAYKKITLIFILIDSYIKLDRIAFNNFKKKNNDIKNQ